MTMPDDRRTAPGLGEVAAGTRLRNRHTREIVQILRLDQQTSADEVLDVAVIAASNNPHVEQNWPLEGLHLNWAMA